MHEMDCLLIVSTIDHVLFFSPPQLQFRLVEHGTNPIKNTKEV